MKEICLTLTILCFGAIAAHGETPDLGPFTNFFFIDRWGQGVFGYHFVDPANFDVLSSKGWQPLKVDATISAPLIPGGIVIQQVRSVSVLSDPRITIHLSLNPTVIKYGESAQLSVTLGNLLTTNHDLNRQNLYLSITTNKRGTSPLGTVERDNIYDSFNNSYLDFKSMRTLYARATNSVCLSTDVGTISMQDGRPFLQITTEEKVKEAASHDEDIRKIEPAKSQTFHYEIGPGWLVNEYELYAFYRYKDECAEDGMKFTMSKAISFDVD